MSLLKWMGVIDKYINILHMYKMNKNIRNFEQCQSGYVFLSFSVQVLLFLNYIHIHNDTIQNKEWLILVNEIRKKK